MWSWGSSTASTSGQNNTGINYSSPVQIGAGITWKMVSLSSYMAGATKTDGTLWLWGYNGYGNLGINSSVAKSSPTQVGTDTNWSTVYTGVQNALAVKSNNTLWSWGLNNVGQLGQNDTINRSSPVQVGAGTTWSANNVVCTAFCSAIKTDGTLWVWGNGAFGNLGKNNTVIQSSPVQVGIGTNWSKISATRSGGDPGVTLAIAT